MYEISIPGATLPARTLAAVVALFRDERLKNAAGENIGLAGGRGDARITRYNGELALRCDGEAADMVARMLDEIRQSWSSTDGGLMAPWQIRRPDWDVFLPLFDLARRPQLFLSTDQIESWRLKAQAARERFDLSDLCDRLARERFGFGAEGPRVEPAGQPNGRHEVHVAYALLANRPVPQNVIDDYLQDASLLRHGPYWAVPLVGSPALRGAMSCEKLQALSSVMRGEGVPLTDENAGALIAAIADLPADANAVLVDDTLFAAGLLGPVALPPVFSVPVDVGAAVSPLSARLRQLNADDRRDRSLARADEQRRTREISARRHAQLRAIASLDHGRVTFDWSNRFSAALESRDIGTLLPVLDSADDWNVRSKQVFEEFHGVRLADSGRSRASGQSSHFAGWMSRSRRPGSAPALHRNWLCGQ